jgi:tetratricopeptide (TPR) repeat protein
MMHPLVEETLITAGGLARGDVHAKLAASSIKSELKRLTREIESGDESVAKYQARAKFSARIGRWHDSADDFQHAVKLNPASRYPWLQLAPVLILAGEEQRYKATCQDLVGQFRGTDQPDVADVVCKVALLGPQNVDLSDLPVETLRDAATDPTWARYRTWFIACCALISYREGEHQKAVEWVRKIDGRTGRAETLALVVRALAEHQLGESEKARATLTQAESNIPVKLRTLGTGDYHGLLPVSSSIVHHDWLIPEILRREAESLLNAQP